MNVTDLITLIRNELKEVCNCYSPDFPQKEELCSAISLGTGTNQRANNKNILYSDIPVYLLIRGTSNDKETRELVDKIFNNLDMKENIIFNKTRVILISCQTPNYAFRDENQRIYYNINMNVKVEWRND